MSYQQNEYPEQSQRPARSVDNITDFAPPQLTGSSYMSTPPHASNDTDRRDSYQPQFVPDMSSNFKRDNNHGRQYTKGSYRGSQDYARNLRIQQFNEGYRPEARSSTSDQPALQTRTGSASHRDGLPTRGTDAAHHTRDDDDYDTNSVTSSIYSQPSAIAAHSDRASHVQDFSSETNRHSQARDQAVPNEEEKPYVAYDNRGYEDTGGHYEQPHSYENYQQRRNISTSATESEQQLYEAGYEGENIFRHPYNVNEEQNHSPAEGGYYGDNYRPVDPYGQYDVYSDFNNTRIPQDNFRNEGSGRMNNLVYPTDETTAQSGDRAETNPGSDEKPRETIAATQKKTEKSKKRRCCSRQACVLITFIVLLVLAVALFFVWPRKPEVQISGATQDDTSNATISKIPPRVQMNFNLQVQLRNQANWIPIRFKKIDVKMFDSSAIANNDPVATGQLTDYTLTPRTDTDLPIPMTIDYIGKDANDATLNDFIDACTTNNGTITSTLNIRADFQLFIWGISGIYKPTVSAGKPDLKCPYEVSLSGTN